jgi:SAM-dependent methyltransferase
MEFNKSYTQYWESAVQKSVDGTVIAGLREVDLFLSPLGLSNSDRVLDLGCSTGRMCEALTRYSSAVYGAEPDTYAVGKASAKPYQEVLQGTAEATGYPARFFDFVFCWAVFDVVDHFDGLSEINRILKDGGRFLITCKADNYDPEDVLAFKAEKNAFLKGFPNKFTNLALLCRQLGAFGFELTELVTFPRRGDMGLLNYTRQRVAESPLGEVIDAYEYLMVAKKISTPASMQKDAGVPLDGQFSATAKTLAAHAGYASVKEYFESIGID